MKQFGIAIIFLVFTSLLSAEEQNYPTVCDIQLHDVVFDARWRHVELSYLDKNGVRIFYNAFNNTTHRPASGMLKGADLVFTIRLKGEEIAKFHNAISEYSGGLCTIGACHILSKATGMFIPVPFVLFPRQLEMYFLFLRMVNAKRIINVKILGSKFSYVLGRQLMPIGLVETAVITYLIYQGAKYVFDDGNEPPAVRQDTEQMKKEVSNYHLYEIEYEKLNGEIGKQIINIGIIN